MKSFAALPFRDKARKVRTPKNSKEFPGSLEKSFHNISNPWQLVISLLFKPAVSLFTKNQLLL